MSPYLEDKLSFAKEVSEEDRKQILKLYRQVWGEQTGAGMEKIFPWKFESSPFMPKDKLPLLVYRAEGRIVALLGGVPYLIKYGDQYQPTVCIMDFLSHPSYRSKGLWLSFKMALDNPIVFGVSGEENRGAMWRMMAKRKKRPQTDIGTYRHLVRKLDISHAAKIRRILRFRPLISFANLLWKGYHRLFKSWRLNLSQTGLRTREVGKFGEEINRLWEMVKDDYKIIPMRTDAYLNWRFFGHPTNRYHRFLLEQRGEIKAYLVLRLIEKKREKIGRIVDLLASRKDENFYRALVSFALRFFEERRVDTVQALESTCPELKKAFTRNGFSPRLTTQRSMQMQAWQREDYVPPEFFYNPDNWYFTYADSDFEMLPPGHFA